MLFKTLVRILFLFPPLLKIHNASRAFPVVSRFPPPALIRHRIWTVSCARIPLQKEKFWRYRERRFEKWAHDTTIMCTGGQRACSGVCPDGHCEALSLESRHQSALFCVNAFDSLSFCFIVSSFADSWA